MSENTPEVALLKSRIESLEAEISHLRGSGSAAAGASIFEIISQNQPALQSFLKHTTYGVLIKDQDLRLRFINLPAQKLLGLTEDALLMQTSGGIFDSRLAEELERDDRMVLQHRQYIEREYDLVASGKPQRMRAHKSPIFDTDGTVVGLFITMVPIKQSGESIVIPDLTQHRRFIPICSSCKSIRERKGSWISLEKYLANHLNADTTHTICPECARALYPDIHLKSLS